MYYRIYLKNIWNDEAIPKNAAKQLRFLEGLSSLENTEIAKAEFMTRFNVVQADVKKAVKKVGFF